MAARVEDVRALASLHAREVCENPDKWMSYLNSAARFYRYPFADSLLIHAQKPTATAVASLPDWNDHLGRWVKKGSVGIALFDDSGTKLRVRYVFDIRDTERSKNFKRIYLWRMERKHEEKIREHLMETYGLCKSEKETMPQLLMRLSKHLTSENIRQAMYDLNHNRDNSYLAAMDEVALLRDFSDLVEQSLSYVLMQRCGYHPMEHMSPDSFSCIRLFDDINVLPYLGEAVHTIAEPVLLDIGKEIREMDLMEHQKDLEKAPVPGQIQFNLDGSEVTFEVKDHREVIDGERQDKAGSDKGGGLLLPELKDGGGTSGEHEKKGNTKRNEGKKPGSISEVHPDRDAAIGEIVAAAVTAKSEVEERKKDKKPLKKHLAEKKDLSAIKDKSRVTAKAKAHIKAEQR